MKFDDPELSRLQELERNLEEKLASTRSNIEALKRILWSQATGVSVGGIVRDRKGVLYRVVEIKNPDFDYVTGNPQKKDGTFGKHLHTLFDWEKA